MKTSYVVPRLFSMVAQITALIVMLYAMTISTVAQNIRVGGEVRGHLRVTRIEKKCVSILYVDQEVHTLQPGMRVVVIQVQMHPDSTLQPSVRYDLSGVGQFDFATVADVDGSRIVLQEALLQRYDPTAVVQVVPVIKGRNITVDAELTPIPFDGLRGGILAFEATDSLILLADVNAEAKGFHGGSAWPGNGECSSLLANGLPGNPFSSGKGMSLALPPAGSMSGRSPYITGGGAGVAHNSGGGGGGNGVNGGKGGREHIHCVNPVDNGGIGGLSVGNRFGYFFHAKVYLGGGGGAGHQNNNTATNGANGGGIVLIRASFVKGNGHTISVRGGTPRGIATFDGAGGGGAGGTIAVDIPNWRNIVDVNLNLAGGDGGNVSHATEAYAPGGGGGGGRFYSTCAFPSTDSEGRTSIFDEYHVRRDLGKAGYNILRPDLNTGAEDGTRRCVDRNDVTQICREYYGAAFSGLTGVFPFSLPTPPTNVIVDLVDTVEICPKGNAQIIPVLVDSLGPYDVQWVYRGIPIAQQPTLRITDAQKGVVVLHVRDARGCTTMDSVHVVITPRPAVTTRNVRQLMIGRCHLPFDTTVVVVNREADTIPIQFLRFDPPTSQVSAVAEDDVPTPKDSLHRLHIVYDGTSVVRTRAIFSIGNCGDTISTDIYLAPADTITVLASPTSIDLGSVTVCAGTTVDSTVRITSVNDDVTIDTVWSSQGVVVVPTTWPRDPRRQFTLPVSIGLNASTASLQDTINVSVLAHGCPTVVRIPVSATIVTPNVSITSIDTIIDDCELPLQTSVTIRTMGAADVVVTRLLVDNPSVTIDTSNLPWRLVSGNEHRVNVTITDTATTLLRMWIDGCPDVIETSIRLRLRTSTSQKITVNDTVLPCGVTTSRVTVQLRDTTVNIDVEQRGRLRSSDTVYIVSPPCGQRDTIITNLYWPQRATFSYNTLVDFGSIPASTSVDTTIPLVNTSAFPVTVTNVNINAGPWTITTLQPNLPWNLASGDTAYVTVEGRGQEGALSGVITFSDDSPCRQEHRINVTARVDVDIDTSKTWTIFLPEIDTEVGSSVLITARIPGVGPVTENEPFAYALKFSLPSRMIQLYNLPQGVTVSESNGVQMITAVGTSTGSDTILRLYGRVLLDARAAMIPLVFDQDEAFVWTRPDNVLTQNGWIRVSDLCAGRYIRSIAIDHTQIRVERLPFTSTDHLAITYNGTRPSTNVTWRLIDLTGNIVHSGTASLPYFTIDVTALSTGLYRLHIQGQGLVWEQSILLD